MTALQTWVDAAKLTDEALAAKVGVSRVQITRIRNGVCRPSVKTAQKLAEVTGVPAANFILPDLAPRQGAAA